MRDRTFVAARENLLRRLPARWCTELFDDCDGGWSLVVMTPDDDAEATYVIVPSDDGFVLASLRDDEFGPSERHASLDAVLDAIVLLAGPDDPVRTSQSAA